MFWGTLDSKKWFLEMYVSLYVRSLYRLRHRTYSDQIYTINMYSGSTHYGGRNVSELSLNIKLYFAQKHSKNQFKMFTKNGFGGFFKHVLKIGLKVL